MNKKFFEVFPTLKVNQEMKNLFEDVDVTKVTTNSDRVYLHVHLKSTHLLPKKFVNAMETAVKEQLFSQTTTHIHFVEEYYLSKQYTPENLFREYNESILYELKMRSVVEYNMFVNAKCKFKLC